MKIMQFYETSITDLDGKQGLSAIIVPNRSIPNTVETSFDWLDELGFKRAEEISSSELPIAIACLIAKNGKSASQDNNDQKDALQLYRQLVMGFSKLKIVEEIGIEVYEFAEQVSYSRLIPFEQSPLELTTLAELYSKVGVIGGATTIGAYAGWCIAGSTPLLILAAPAGMIIFSAAAGIALGLGEGLKKRIIGRLSGENEEKELSDDDLMDQIKIGFVSTL